VHPDSLPIVTVNGDYYRSVQVSSEDHTTLRAYWRAVDASLGGGSSDELSRYAGLTLGDEAGRTYMLLTDLDALYQLFNQMTDEELREHAQLIDRDNA